MFTFYGQGLALRYKRDSLGRLWLDRSARGEMRDRAAVAAERGSALWLSVLGARGLVVVLSRQVWASAATLATLACRRPSHYFSCPATVRICRRSCRLGASLGGTIGLGTFRRLALCARHLFLATLPRTARCMSSALGTME